MNHTELTLSYILNMQVLFVEKQKPVAQNILLVLYGTMTAATGGHFLTALSMRNIWGEMIHFYIHAHMSGTLIITASFRKC
jgi:hypothetical protein